MARGEDNRSARTGCQRHTAGIPSRWPKGIKRAEEVHAAALAADPEFAAEWERLALARMISTTLIAYRSDRGLSQRELAKLLGGSQPDVVALESGEKNPQIETLIKGFSGCRCRL
ncbi:MAG TPA: helix-turn-helix transcriptional regulator [Solirubrobacteraceae bacterium]|nr:helix-turn-helix transcriptional regulator [Solirubrobacteraceae bacterium]